ncbi:hypothetical protein KM043_002666 [Ampulex compressa]|nr:hypothetical protein KM043_002666 [Ampulex compressa]
MQVHSGTLTAGAVSAPNYTGKADCAAHDSPLAGSQPVRTPLPQSAATYDANEVGLRATKEGEPAVGKAAGETRSASGRERDRKVPARKIRQTEGRPFSLEDREWENVVHKRFTKCTPMINRTGRGPRVVGRGEDKSRQMECRKRKFPGKDGKSGVGG